MILEGSRNVPPHSAGGAVDLGLNILKKSYVKTPLGSMLAIADNQFLYLLEFVERWGLEPEIERLRMQTKSEIVSGLTDPLLSIQDELEKYFEGKLQVFETPICILGSLFQKRAWEALRDIPYGKTKSYAEQASTIGRPSACRAVANANAANQVAIVVPCHRIINSNGALGGYAAGLARKKWLLQHEKEHAIL